jgi:hypothetical protein
VLIRITGPAEALDEDEKAITDEAVLARLNGAVYDEDVCSNYIDSELVALGVSGGAVKLVFEPKYRRLLVVTEYITPRKLKPAELKQLTRDTVAQWSDGIGEGCFDELADCLDVLIDLSPFHQAKELHVEQIDDGVKAPRSKAGLARAAKEGDLDAVRRLLDAGADREARLQGDTALQLAVIFGHVDVALELIERGADLNAVDSIGHDALMNCAASNTLRDADAARLARVLLDKGVDVHAERGEPSAYTPLYMAKNRKKKKLEQVLREFGAKK